MKLEHIVDGKVVSCIYRRRRIVNEGFNTTLTVRFNNVSYNSEWVKKMSFGRRLRYRVLGLRRHILGLRIDFLNWRIVRLQKREEDFSDGYEAMSYVRENLVWRTTKGQ